MLVIKNLFVNAGGVRATGANHTKQMGADQSPPSRNRGWPTTTKQAGADQSPAGMGFSSESQV